jgi:PAS domain S-box-containing protein
MPTPAKTFEKENQDSVKPANNFYFKEILERISDAFVALDSKWCYTYMNKKAGEIFNRDPHAMIGRHIWTEFPEGIGQPFYKAYYKAMEQQEYIYLEEYYEPYDSWFENHIYPTTEGLSIFFRDITVKKKAEEALTKSERRYHTLTETSPVGIFHTDTQGYTTYVNTRWTQISGMSHKEALGNGWLNAVHKNDREHLIKGWQEATKSADISMSEYRFVHPDGTIVWVMGQATPERNFEHQIIGYVGTTTDITERKKAEEEIAKIHRENETVLNRISDAVVSIDNEWRYTFLNDAALSTHPLGRARTLGKVIWDVHPEMKGTEFWDKYHYAMESKESVEIESYYEPMDTWFSAKVYPSHDGITIIYKNITARKKAEEALNQNRIFIESIINASPDIIYIYDIEERRNIYVNEGIQRNLNYTDFEIKQMGDQLLPILMHPEDFEYYRYYIFPKYSTAKDKEIIVHEFRMRDKNGEWHWLYCKESIFLRDPDGNPKQIFGITSDITERKKIEDEISKEKLLSDSIINSLPGIFYLYDDDGKFLRWNKNFETITGYTSKEIQSMHPLDFFCDEEKPLLKQKITEVFNEGVADVEACLFTRNEEKIDYYFNGWRIEYEGKSCLIGVGIDISGRKQAEEEIKQATSQLRKLTTHLQNIRDEERKRIGREIHDELGQQLTAIKMDVAWINKKTHEESPLIKTKLKNIINLLDSSNLSVRKILHELRADILDSQGLKNALEWQAKQFFYQTGIPIVFDCSEISTELNEPTSNCIFRVFQEALTNITKYAEPKKVVSSLRAEDNRITFKIEDDGKGFDVLLLRNTESFGILGMKERVNSLNGNFNLTSSPGKGTKIIITLPVNL